MKRLSGLVLCLLVVIVLSGCAEEGVVSGKLVSGGTLTVAPGQEERSHILLLDGTVQVAEGGTVVGNIYQLLGTLAIDGQVIGDVVHLGGEIALGPAARIDGDLRLSSDSASDGADQAVTGQVTRDEPAMTFGLAWLQQNAQRQAGWAVGETVILATLAALLGALYAAGLGRIGRALARDTLVCLAMGLLVALVGLALIVQMAFTIVLIPVSMIGLLLLVLAVGLGWIALGAAIGGWLAQRLNLTGGREESRWFSAASAGLGTLLLMAALNLLALLPAIGDLLAMASAVAGLGAVFLTRFGLQTFTRQP
jgi:cytoskeletal protein CcmA (bactofilin family)